MQKKKYIHIYTYIQCDKRNNNDNAQNTQSIMNAFFSLFPKIRFPILYKDIPNLSNAL